MRFKGKIVMERYGLLMLFLAHNTRPVISCLFLSNVYYTLSAISLLDSGQFSITY